MKIDKNLYPKFTRMGEGGYLVVPRRLLNEALDMEGVFTPAQAYLFLFVNCEFCDRAGGLKLKRGQMAFTSGGLAKVFKWSKSAVRNFLYALKDMGVITLDVVPGVKSKLTMCYYEALTGGQGRPLETEDKLEFFTFWKNYYELLDRDGSDYYPALMEWRRLSKKDRKLAVERVERYFRSLPDIRFVKAVTNYLRCKAFLMPEDV